MVQCENTYVIVIAARGDESARIRFTWCNDTYTGHEIGVARQTVHLREAVVWAVERGRESKDILNERCCSSGKKWLTIAW